MMRVGIVVVLSAALHLAVEGAGEQVRFSTGATAVVIDVAVTHDGKPVAGLTKTDFIVTDNGVPQDIQDLSSERLPVDVHLTVDVSGSMTAADRRVVNDAMTQVSGALRPDDRISATVFWAHISERVPLRAPTVPMVLTDTGQDTAVVDAMLLALVRPELLDRRQFSLFMTDGLDSASYFDEPVVLATARHSKGPMTVVLAPDRASRSGTGDMLRSVAHQTGGEVITLKDRANLRDTFNRALDTFRSSYVVRYFPSGVAPGGWHQIDVSVPRGNYTVRARKGYAGI